MARPGIGYPVYQQPSRVTFGTGSVKALADDGIESAVVFLSGRADVRTALDAALARRGTRLDESRLIVKPSGEPTVDMVKRGAEFLAGHDATRVVGIGGGSVLDWCRLSWAAARDLLSFETGRVAPPSNGVQRPAITLVPTTCGTGAEAAGVAVYSDGDRKRAAISKAFVADQVILDAQFLRTVDAFGMACSLADTLSHGIEAYVSLVPGTLAKEAAAGAVRLVLEHAGTSAGSCRDERLMEAGYLGGVAASNCSVGVIHAFAHALAAFDIGHGHANAIGLTAGILTNADVPAMASLAGRCGLGGPIELMSGVRTVLAPALSAHVAGRVGGLLNDPRARAGIMDRMAQDVCLRSNPRPMNEDDLKTFLGLVEETLAPSWSAPS